jgi:protoporphyrinogen oxidase
MIESVTVIGAGPAGLTAAHELVRHGVRPILLEKADKVGGIARTECHDGFRFDIGGHRFFTKDQQVDRLWHEMLGDDLLLVERLSRISYRGRFFDYPLDIADTLSTLGIVESLRILLSYLKAQAQPSGEEDTFEQWVTNRFGRRLYEVFFKTYTEKVWGIPCSEIRSDWAAQRIKGLSLKAAFLNALLGNNEAKTLINQFHYPVLGPGMMWETFRRSIEDGGGEVLLDTEAVTLVRSDSRIEAVVARSGSQEMELYSEAFISSMPLPELVASLHPPPPEKVLDAARKLRYRSFLIVGLVVGETHLFPDHWIYLHNPEVKAARIQNIKNWSAAMVPDLRKTSLGVEYFCDVGDEIWSMRDADLVALATRELGVLGLADAKRVEQGVVFRQPSAYPVYDNEYHRQRRVIRAFLSTIDNLQTIGRNGLHHYNNMDHSMRTGLLAARNVLGGKHDVWEVNEDEVYLEEEARVPAEATLTQEVLARAFARLHPLAFATAVGLTAGLALFLATIWLLVKGGEVVGPNLGLLSQYLPGYRVTTPGALIGFGYACICGFVFGWSFATLRNLLLWLYISGIRRRVEWLSLRESLDRR